eukprot:1146007-Pelagomonas_calceolata.AAC.2
MAQLALILRLPQALPCFIRLCHCDIFPLRALLLFLRHVQCIWPSGIQGAYLGGGWDPLRGPKPPETLPPQNGPPNTRISTTCVFHAL